MHVSMPAHDSPAAAAGADGTVCGWQRRLRGPAGSRARHAHQRPTAPGQTGRAVLRTMRAVNDMRATSRGTYGTRLLRRSVFRVIRRW